MCDSVVSKQIPCYSTTVPAEHTHTTVLWPFFRDHPGEPVPEENKRTSGLYGARED